MSRQRDRESSGPAAEDRGLHEGAEALEGRQPSLQPSPDDIARRAHELYLARGSETGRSRRG